MNENEKTSKAGEEKRHKIRSTVVTVVVSVFFAFIIFVYYSMLSAEKKNTIILNGRVTAEDSADQIDQYLDTNIESLKLAAYALDEIYDTIQKALDEAKNRTPERTQEKAEIRT
ncbi:MAG: hypothetical protein IJJ13_04295 [Lachnospiraceae bacterium]|nr:hypothetical protein [Lachnospiraceae bacterium]